MKKETQMPVEEERQMEEMEQDSIQLMPVSLTAT